MRPRHSGRENTDVHGPGCADPAAHGWLAVPVFLFIVVFGSYVLPTVLIGTVAISFDEATKRLAQNKAIMDGMRDVIRAARNNMPRFFGPGRVESNPPRRPDNKCES